MNHAHILPDDELSRQKGLVTHYGIAFDYDSVMEIMPNSTPRLVTVEEFADGNPIGIRQSPEEERPSIMQRAMLVLSVPEEYRYLTNNCEHLKNFVLTGKPYSETVWRLAFIAFATITIYAVKRRG